MKTIQNRTIAIIALLPKKIGIISLKSQYHFIKFDQSEADRVWVNLKYYGISI